MTSLGLLVLVAAWSPLARGLVLKAPPKSIAPRMSVMAETQTYPSLENFDLGAYLKTKVKAIEVALDASLVSETPETKKIVESMRYSLLAGGKRIRPVMCIAACEMFGGTEADAMPTAVAIEMIHTMSLIHDDLPSMDNDDLRRGMPTNHVVYGDDVAILAGDALLSTAFEHCAAGSTAAKVPAERIVEVVRRLGEAVGAVGLAGGQVMDLECEAKAGVTLQELTWIHTHKTAKLLEVSVCAGAILAGASAKDVSLCATFANDIGIAFQVADDILDVTATSAVLGKTAGKDLDSDKTTYPKLMGLDGARAEAQRLYDEALESLAPFGDKATPLIAIAKYIVERSS
ncbi:isoprenoid synthase domain-containing protein [Pelagophyceae sp. CCMP2097]|nr:isoprenoid synthase domain-containing protein [Pelagophyceae sp. CCMP2097]